MCSTKELSCCYASVKSAMCSAAPHLGPAVDAVPLLHGEQLDYRFLQRQLSRGRIPAPPPTRFSGIFAAGGPLYADAVQSLRSAESHDVITHPPYVSSWCCSFLCRSVVFECRMLRSLQGTPDTHIATAC